MIDDLAGTLRAAAEAGVEQVVHVGCSRDRMQRAIDIAATDPRIFAVIGIHPHEASGFDDAVARELVELAAAPDVVAIGESGLDFHYNRSPPEAQRESLRRHLRIAAEVDLPLVLHVRDAHEDAMGIVAELPPPRGGIVHCFTGGPHEAERWLALGFHLSFSGIATFKTAEAIREAARLCPDDRILLETDAPYLAPHPVRGRPNTPANVAFTCLHLASVRGEAPHALAARAARNARRLLRLPDPPPA